MCVWVYSLPLSHRELGNELTTEIRQLENMKVSAPTDELQPFTKSSSETILGQTAGSTVLLSHIVIIMLNGKVGHKGP